jgi:hypothetical protein
MHLICSLFGARAPQHVAMVPKSVAALDSESTLVTLAPALGPACLFRVLPRFKLRSLGQRVAAGDKVVLVAAKSGLALHVSGPSFGPPECAAEVSGSSSGRTGFGVQLYADHDAGGGGDCVLGGDLVRLWHAEADGALVLDPPRAAAAGAAPATSVYVRAVRAAAAAAGSVMGRRVC